MSFCKCRNSSVIPSINLSFSQNERYRKQGSGQENNVKLSYLQ